MKNNKTVKILVVILVFFLILGVVEIILFTRNKQKKNLQNEYQFSTDTTKEDDIITYTNDNLKKSHCLDSICIENVVFYYYEDGGGRIEYTIQNTSDKEVSGMIKLVFGEESLIAYYAELGANSKIETSSYYQNKVIKNKDNYTLSKLSEEEESKVVVINK